DSDCRLAKAEALRAAGAAWLRASNDTRAQTDFDAATGLVKSVPDLPLGKMSVILSIATAQARGGIIAGAGTNFRLAKELALELPTRPALSKGPAKKAPATGIHYR